MNKEEIMSYITFYINEAPHNIRNDCISLSYKSMQTLYEYYLQLKHCIKFLDNVIVTPEKPNDINTKYQLHNYTKQELYKDLYLLRKYIIENHLYF